MNKTAEILLKAFQQVLGITNQFMKFAAEQEKKEKQRKSKQPPKVYFQRDGPYPQIQSQNDKNKKNIMKGNEKLNNHVNQKRAQIQNKIKNAYEKYINPVEQKNAKKQGRQSMKEQKQQKQTEQDQKKNKKITYTKNTKEQPPKNKKDQKPPEKPKAPISAFLRFNKAHMQEVKKNYPHMSQPDLVSVTGHMWSQSPPDVKKKYQEQYARDKERYDAAMIQYNRKYPQQKSKKQLQLEKSLNNK